MADSLFDKLPPEPCIICNKAARDAMEEGARKVTEDLLAEYPPECMTGIPCWNCYGTGMVHDEDGFVKLARALEKAKDGI